MIVVVCRSNLFSVGVLLLVPFRPTGLQDKISRIVDSATDTELVHLSMHDLLPANTYFRFNPYMSFPYTLDEIDPKKFVSAFEHRWSLSQFKEFISNYSRSSFSPRKFVVCEFLKHWFRLCQFGCFEWYFNFSNHLKQLVMWSGWNSKEVKSFTDSILVFCFSWWQSKFRLAQMRRDAQLYLRRNRAKIETAAITLLRKPSFFRRVIRSVRKFANSRGFLLPRAWFLEMFLQQVSSLFLVLWKNFFELGQFLCNLLFGLSFKFYGRVSSKKSVKTRT